MPVARRALALAIAVGVLGTWARADELAAPLSGQDILGRPAPWRLESLRARYTHFDQDGRGYQSQADRASNDQPGSEAAVIEQPQLEAVARQGKFTHRLWVPLDIITAASPDALDAISTASRQNESGSIDLTSTYHATRVSNYFVHAAFHLEEPFRSFFMGFGGTRAFADDNTVIGWSLNQVFDWLDRFNIFGTRLGRAYRSSTNANLSVTQLLSPTTVAHLNYGVTVQLGELSNTWNAVPLSTGELGNEQLPRLRHRHAFVGRLAQALPWHGAAKGFYRFYVDNWGILAHTIELELYQRLTPYAYLRANWRYHTQTAPPFWSTSASPTAIERTADSDLAAFSANTLGILAASDIPMSGRVRQVHVDVGYERYFRSNSLTANIYTCSLGFLF